VTESIGSILLQTVLGFIATLTATLIGVKLAFDKDRQADQKEAQKRVLQHLKAIRKESKINKSVAENNFELLIKLQGRDNGADSYVLELFSTQAWDKAMNNRVNELIDPELQGELQQIYSRVQTVNELIRRLRTEPLHSTIGEEATESTISDENWTMEVSFYNSDTEETENSGLGDLIKNECNDIKISIKKIEDQLSEEISDLESDTQEPSGSDDNYSNKGTIWE
jgi:hypothetical protein